MGGRPARRRPADLDARLAPSARCSRSATRPQVREQNKNVALSGVYAGRQSPPAVMTTSVGDWIASGYSNSVDDVLPVAFGQSAPDAIRFLHLQGVVAARGDDRALFADGLGGGVTSLLL